MRYKEYIDNLKETIDKNINRNFELSKLSEEITSKVTEDNKYREFYGDTSVFKMKKEDIEKCKIYLDELLEKFDNNMVSLEPDSFHITLTSFNNPYVIQSFDKEKNIEAINKTRKEIIKLYGTEFLLKNKEKKIRLKAYKLDITSAIVIRFCPVEEKDYNLLMELREFFDTLNFDKKREITFFQPHVSLAYLNNSNDTLEKIEEIRKWCLEKNKNLDIEVELSVKDLTYQYHTDMGNFIDVINLGMEDIYE
jgi:hypothetical protein